MRQRLSVSSHFYAFVLIYAAKKIVLQHFYPRKTQKKPPFQKYIFIINHLESQKFAKK